MKIDYKDRDCQETIYIIKNFFTSKNFNLTYKLNISENSIYSYHIKLFYKDLLILFSNGKGISQEAALASGLAELYERFCLCGQHHWNYLFMEKIKSYNWNTNKYYFAKDEKIFTYEEYCDNDKISYSFFNSLFHQDKDAVKFVMETITNKHFIGLPYKNISKTSNLKYYDYRLLTRANSSSGMAAGNSFKETFNQGFSELLERICFKDFFDNKIKKYYCISQNCFTNSTTIDYLKQLEKNNIEIYIIDFGYINSFPVIGLIAVDKKNYSTRVSFGSFPDKEIALQRAITELYQNIYSFADDTSFTQLPYKNFTPVEATQLHIASLGRLPYIPEKFFEDIIIKDTASNIWTSGSNEEIYNYYLNFIKTQHLNVFYRDYSLIDEMYSLHIVIDNINIYYQSYENILSKCNEEDNNLLFDLLYYFINFCKAIQNNNIEQIINNHSIIKIQQPIYLRILMSIIMGVNWSDPLSFSGFVNLPNLNFNLEMNNFLKHSIYYNNYQKFAVLTNYKTNNCYTNLELKKILWHFGLIINDIDLKYWDNTNYLTKKIFYETLINFYNSQDYEYIISTFCK